MECKEFDQYVIKIDGTGRLTKRNRKFLRKLTPITRKPLPMEEENFKPISPPGLLHVPVEPSLIPAGKPRNLSPAAGPVRVDNEDPGEVIAEYNFQQEKPGVTVQGHVLPPPGSPTAPCSPPPRSPAPQAATAPVPPTHSTPPTPQSGLRPQRVRKQNVKYSADEWDLGPVTNEHPKLSNDLIKDIIYFLASRLGYQQESQP